MTDICGISVEDHLGRYVRDCVPALADAVEGIVQSIMRTGDPVTGVEVAGQRADQTDERFWVTYWHPRSQRRAVKSSASMSLPRRSPSASAPKPRGGQRTAVPHVGGINSATGVDGRMPTARCTGSTVIGTNTRAGPPARSIRMPGIRCLAIAGPRALATGTALECGVVAAQQGRRVSPVPDARRSAARSPRRGLWLDRYAYRHQRAPAQRAGSADGQGCGRSRVAEIAARPRTG